MIRGGPELDDLLHDRVVRALREEPRAASREPIVTWCPAAIDITAEAAALRGAPGSNLPE